MFRVAQGIRAVVGGWPRVVAESLGLREPEPMRAPAGRLPGREAWASSSFGACWLGQATVLLRMGRITILTDPHFEERAGVQIAGKRVGRRRTTALPGSVDDLPPIDVLLLSHAHMDHWDRASLRRLAHRRTTAVIPAGTRRLLPSGFGHVVELAWSHEASARDMRLTAIRPRHWGARWLVDTHRGYNAYLIEAGGKRVLFAGDTAHTDAFDHLGRGGAPGAKGVGAGAPSGRRGVDLAIMGIGSYEPWIDHHATPEQAADMARRMGARLLMPVHHSTFRDSLEPVDEPLERLRRAWDPSRIVCGRVGESWFAA